MTIKRIPSLRSTMNGSASDGEKILLYRPPVKYTKYSSDFCKIRGRCTHHNIVFVFTVFGTAYAAHFFTCSRTCAFSFPIHALNHRTYYLLLNSQFPYDAVQYALSVFLLCCDSFARLSVLALIFHHNRQLHNVQLMINSLNVVLKDQFAVINVLLLRIFTFFR